MYTTSDIREVRHLNLAYDLQVLMQSLSRNFSNYGEFRLFLIGSLIHDLFYCTESKKANDIDLVLFIQKGQDNFLPILSSFFACPHVSGLYQLMIHGGYKVDLMVVETDLKDPHFLVKHVIDKHDFTVSSLFCDFRGKLMDPLDRGLKDLSLKTLSLVSEDSLSEVINPLTCLRALKYVQRGFNMSPRLHEVLLALSYQTAFDDAHFCNLLKRQLLQDSSIIDTMSRLGFLEKFLDPGREGALLTSQSLYKCLLNKSLKPGAMTKMKDELTLLERENAELRAQRESLDASLVALQVELLDINQKIEPLKMNLSELQDTFHLIKHEICEIEKQIEERRRIIQAQALVIEQKLAQKYRVINENLSLKECLQKNLKSAQTTLKHQIKADQFQAQKLNQTVMTLKKKKQELGVSFSTASSLSRRLKDELHDLSHQIELMEVSLEEKTRQIDKLQFEYREKLIPTPSRLLKTEYLIHIPHQKFSVFEKHPWDKLDEADVEFMFKYGQDARLRVLMGFQLARHLIFQSQDYGALLTLIFCQHLLEKHPSDLSKTLDYLCNKIKLKHSRFFWEIKTDKEWYELAQQIYGYGRCSEAIIFYYMAHQINEDYIHPVVQIINAALQLRNWNFLSLGLNFLIKFSDPVLTPPKRQAHALKIFEGVFQKLMTDYQNLAQSLDSPVFKEEMIIKLWDLVAIHHLLDLEVFREKRALDSKPMLSMKACYHKILERPGAERFSKLLAHLNLANITEDSVEVHEHLSAAIEMNLLPDLESFYASSSLTRSG